MQFLSGGYFAFSGYPTKKRIVPIDAACFPSPETTKIQKSPKINLSKHSATAMTRSLSPEKHVYYLHKKKNTEEDQSISHSEQSQPDNNWSRTVSHSVSLHHQSVKSVNQPICQ